MDSGRSLTSEADINQHIQAFYVSLYSNDVSVENNLEARQKCLLSVPVRMTPAMNESLTSEITTTEVSSALKDLPPDKAPGHDTIPKELLQEMWDDIGEDLVSFIRDSLDKGEIAKSIKYGLTSLIPKEGTLTLIKNFRPISVLPSTYKLIAKTLANRVQPILPSCVQDTQTAFVKERNILDNVFLATESIHYACESGQEIVILLLDFE